jgi:hypothetical protein
MKLIIGLRTNYWFFLSVLLPTAAKSSHGPF